VYNGALNLLGKPHIISTNDDSEIRVALDSVIDSGAINYLYELAKPKFALESVKLTSSAASDEHDLDNVFTLPADYLAICELHADPLLDEPINRYIIEGRTLACNYSTIYLRYVSSDLTTSDWTPAFRQVLSAYLADQLRNRFVEDKDMRADIHTEYEVRLKTITAREGYKEPDKRATRSTATLSNTWRKVYNKAFFILGLDEIVSNDDDSIRRAKADVVIGMGLVNTVLEDVGWTFGVSSSELTYDPSLEPDWGHNRVFAKPTDMHRLDGIFSDSFFRSPLKDYEDEGDYWYCGLDTIYVKYIKTSFLTDPDLWPQYFSNLIAAHLAFDIGSSLKGDMENARERLDRYQSEAMSTDAMSGPPQLIKEGGWARSRRSGHRRAGSYDGRP
jgi:hypothetical protein